MKTFAELALLLNKFCQKLRKKSKMTKIDIKILKMAKATKIFHFLFILEKFSFP